MIYKFRSYLHNVLRDVRIRAIGLTSIFSGIAKSVQVILGLYIVPISLSYLGKERYGLMMTIISFIGMIGFADLGMGLGLQNRIPSLLVNNKKKELRKLISNFFFLLIIIVLVICLIFTIIFPILSWDEIFKVGGAISEMEVKQSVFFFFIAFIAAIPFGIAQRINDGLQKGYLNHIWILLGSLLGFTLLLTCVNLKFGLPPIIVSTYGANSLFLIIGFIYLFRFSCRELRPSLKLRNFVVMKELFTGGLVFFVLQISNLLFQSMDPFIIARKFGIEEVTNYSIGLKLVNVLLIPTQMFVPALLPALNDSIANGDYNWIRKLLKRVFGIILIFSFISVIIIFNFSDDILNIWLEGLITFPRSFILSLCAYVVFLNINLIVSYVGLSSAFVRKTVIFYPIAVFLSIVIKFLLLDKIGLQGVLVISIATLLTFYIAPMLYYLRISRFI